MRTFSLLAAVALTLPTPAAGQEQPLPPANPAPALVLDPGGPAAPVAALAFSPDSTILYVGGADKVVRRFVLAGQAFAPADPARLPPLRVPIGPGNAGAVNAVAVSPDGKWVAAAGRAPARDEAWFGDLGSVGRSADLTGEQKRDLGVVYLFDPANPGGGKVIRGPAGDVRAVAFARPSPATGPVLVVASLEWAADGKRVGAVRVYDAATGKELASRTNLPATGTLPGLAAWSTAGGLRVAIAWPNAGTAAGKLLVWDPATNDTRAFDDGSFNRALAVRYGPDGAARELWSGGFRNLGTGKDESGQVMVRPADKPADGRAVRFPFDGKDYLPQALAAGGDTVAALFETAPAPDKTTRPTELRLLAADGTTRVRVTLSGMALAPGLPVLAASPDGKWVAVGGFADHRVEVYSAAALLGGRAAPQRLGGGTGYTGVSFLAGDKLWFGGPNETPTRGGLVFDLRGRTAGPSQGNAAIDAPAGGVVPVAGRNFVLREGEVVDAVAYLPAGVPWAKGFAPVVAVAHTEPSAPVTLVSLFDPKTGRRLRQLSGPVQRVRALAFSGTRPLLAAVGGDPTVFVWSLTDLGTAEGMIEGLTVTGRGNAVVVESVQATSPARGKLARGDVIAAVGGPEGALKPVTKPHEFRDEVGALPVGGTARVQVKGAAAPVVLPVGRGVGQRGPLFTLWADPAAKPGGPRDWVGWSPAGPYDASSPAAEARIGWLSATGDPAQPTTFAGAGQYRKQYYRRGVLEQLVDKGELVAALAALPPPQAPALDAEVTPTLKAADGTRLLRDPNARLELTLTDPDDVIPLERAVLRWRATGPDGKPTGWQQLPFPGRSAAIDLAKHRWDRGTHTFEIAVHESADASAPAASGTVSIPFVPLPPKLVAVRVGGKAVQPGDEITSGENAVTVSTDVEPGPGGAVAVTLATSRPGEKPQPLATKDGKAFGPLTVKLNENEVTVLRLTAAAEQAGEFARYESDVVEVRVRHTPKPPPVPPPGLRLTLVTAHEPPAAPGGPMVVAEAAATLTAAVKSATPVELVEWDLGDGKGWAAGELDPKAMTATATVSPLEPGQPRTVRVRARHKGGEFATDAVAVEYRPRPPAAEFAGLPPAVLAPGIEVRGSYSQAVAGFEMKVVVAGPRPGQVREFPATTTPGPDPAAGTWRAAVVLFPGSNRLGLVLTNEWRTAESAERPEVAYRRPPVVESVQPVSATAGGTGDVVARVVGDAELPPTGLVVNGRPARTDPPRRLAAVFGLAWWELTAVAASLKSGDAVPDAVAVVAVNADGASRAVNAVVRKLAPPPKPIEPPRITLKLGDGGDRGQPIVTSEPVFTFTLSVAAANRIGRAEVIHGRPSGDRVTPVKIGADGLGAEANPRINLDPGVNRVRVVAANAGGESAAEFTVSYVLPPVRVVIDRVEEVRPGGGSAPLDVLTGGRVDAKGAFLELRGRVVWTDETNSIAADPSLEVVVSANRVVHLPVSCEPRSGAARERAFKAPVFVNAADCAVQIAVRTRAKAAGLPQVGLTATELTVRCQDPLKKQRLHVLVIGVGTPEAGRLGLVRRVIGAIGGTVPPDRPGFDRGAFFHPAFDRAVLYRPLVHDVTRGGVVGLMGEVEREVRQTAAREGAAWVNDLVLVYYEGRDMVGSDKRRRLHTTQSLTYEAPAAEPYAVRVDALPPTPGVRLVVLNVLDPDSRQPAADALAAAAMPPMLRYAWRNATGLAQLFPLIQQAVGARPTVGGVIELVNEGFRKAAAAEPTDEVPDPVRGRRIGTTPP